MSNDNEPLVVYLDTSDFSDFADMKRGSGDAGRREDVRTIYETLLSLRQAGRIVVPISMVHAGELFDLNRIRDEIADAKAEVIDELCGRAALLPLPAIIARNARHEDSLTGKLKGAYRTTDGHWLSETSPSDLALPLFDKATLNQAAHDELQARGLSTARHHRRALIKDAKSSRKPRNERAAALRASAQTDKKTAAMIDILGVDYLTRTFSSPGSQGDFERHLFRRLGDFHLVLKAHRAGHDLTGLFGTVPEFGANIARMVETLFDDLSKAGDLPPRAQLHAFITPLAKGLCQQVVARLASEDERSSAPSGAAAAPLLRDESTYLNWFGAIVAEYFVQRMLNQRDKQKSSDGADLLHAVYAPYVHVWRGDKRTAPLVARVAQTPLWKEAAPKVAHRLLDLPGLLPPAIDPAG